MVLLVLLAQLHAVVAAFYTRSSRARRRSPAQE